MYIRNIIFSFWNIRLVAATYITCRNAETRFRDKVVLLPRLSEFMSLC